MKKVTMLLIVICIFSLIGCAKEEAPPKIGVSFGVGEATRWAKEKTYMEERAAELGVEIEVRLNKDENAKPQKEDCIELIDNGANVLIITARDVYNMKEVLEYAKTKNVPVISYSRLIMNESFDLFVGYDSESIGQKLGKYLSETVISGNYILLKGDKSDYNAQLLYEGAMSYINRNSGSIHIILDEYVPKWSSEEAKKMVLNAVTENSNQVDAILAPNDSIAGGCAEALATLNITNPVALTGMDAQIDAVKRIVAGTQSCTIYMDLRTLSNTAVEEAYNLATKQKVNVNSDFENSSGTPIPSNLIAGQLITKENVDRILIDSGYYSHEDIYGMDEAV